MTTDIKFESVKHITAEEYFGGDKYSVDMFNAKYPHVKEDGNKETPAEVFWRVASELASMEQDEETRNTMEKSWFSLMFEGWFRPGGSIMAGIGSGKKASLNNCTTVPLQHDTLEAIAKCDYDLMKVAAYRQGVGVDLSALRPRGSRVGNAAE